MSVVVRSMLLRHQETGDEADKDADGEADDRGHKEC